MNHAGRLLLALWLAAAAGGASGCASLQAGSAPARPALEAPAPPPRTVEPLPEPEPETPDVETPVPVIVTAPRPATRPSRPSAAKHPVERETPPAPPVATETAKPETAPAGGGLQTTANPTEAERRVRGLLAKAVKDLDQLDPKRLSSGARSQYESARRFVAQSEEALKAGNLVFAEQLADKAAALAAGLLGR